MYHLCSAESDLVPSCFCGSSSVGATKLMRKVLVQFKFNGYTKYTEHKMYLNMKIGGID